MEEEAEENPRDSTVTRVWPDHADFKNRETEPGATEDRCPPEAGKEKVRKWIHSKASRRNQDLP